MPHNITFGSQLLVQTTIKSLWDTPDLPALQRCAGHPGGIIKAPENRSPRMGKAVFANNIVDSYQTWKRKTKKLKDILLCVKYLFLLLNLNAQRQTIVLLQQTKDWIYCRVLGCYFNLSNINSRASGRLGVYTSHWSRVGHTNKVKSLRWLLWMEARSCSVYLRAETF